MRRRWLLLSFSVLLAACTPTTERLTITTEQAALPDFGTTTITGSAVQNAAARQQFLEAYRAGEPGRWETVAPTVEGDPTFHQLLYSGNGTQLLVVRDTRQDHFGPRRVRLYTCQTLVEDGRFLQLVECTDGSDQTNISVPTVP